MRRILVPALLLGSLASLLTVACDKGAPPPGSGSGVTGASGVTTPPNPTLATPGPGETPPGDPSPANPGTGASCGDKTCGAGEECISYYGVAGPAGPKFQECGIRCKAGSGNGGCPEGKTCTTIADGPGPVCR